MKSRFDLAYDIKMAMERVVDLDDLLAALFADHPDLHTLQFEVTNEYDDNNYSDYTRLQKVNGWQVDYEGTYEDEEDEDDPPESPKASQKAAWAAMNLCEFVKDKYGYGDVTFSRADYDWEKSRSKMKSGAELEVAVAVMQGRKVPVETIIKADHSWWSHYAGVHGRYSPEDEFALFAREGCMWAALEYAKGYGPLSEKTVNYFVLSANKDDADYEHLQEYLEWVKGKAA